MRHSKGSLLPPFACPGPTLLLHELGIFFRPCSISGPVETCACTRMDAYQPTSPAIHLEKESAMSRCLGTLIVLVSLFVTTPLWAAQLSRPQVEYSADSVMQTEDTTTEQHVY